MFKRNAPLALNHILLDNDPDGTDLNDEQRIKYIIILFPLQDYVPIISLWPPRHRAQPLTSNRFQIVQG
jgi:hypothetical protein